MPKARQHAATSGGTPDDIEAAFYEALRMADPAWYEESGIALRLGAEVEVLERFRCAPSRFGAWILWVGRCTVCWSALR